MQFKKSRIAVTFLLVATMILSSISAFAASKVEWRYMYTDKTEPYAKVEGRFVNGEWTGETNINGYAKADWKDAGYEWERPYKEYQELYLDGKGTGVTRYTGNFKSIKEEYRIEGYELKAPYKISEYLYSFIPESSKWLRQSIWRYSGKNAKIEKTWKYFGFGHVRVTNGIATDNSSFYNSYRDVINTQGKSHDTLLQKILDYKTLVISKGEDAFKSGSFNDTIENMFVSIPEFESLFINNIDVVSRLQGLVRENLGVSYTELVDNEILRFNGNFAQVSWNYDYELQPPHRGYETLVLNGIEIPQVIRYTGKNATPESVVWKLEGYEKAEPFKYFENLFVNDKKVPGFVRYTGKNASRNIEFKLEPVLPFVNEKGYEYNYEQAKAPFHKRWALNLYVNGNKVVGSIMGKPESKGIEVHFNGKHEIITDFPHTFFSISSSGLINPEFDFVNYNDVVKSLEEIVVGGKGVTGSTMGLPLVDKPKLQLESGSRHE